MQYTPQTQTFSEFTYEFADGEPTRVEVANEDSIWITAPGANRVAVFEPRRVLGEADPTTGDSRNLGGTLSESSGSRRKRLPRSQPK